MWAGLARESQHPPPHRSSSEGREQLSCKVSCTPPHTPQLRKGGSSGGEGGENSLEARTGVLSSFNYDPRGTPGPSVFIFQRLHLSSLQRLLMVVAAGAEQSPGRQETPFAPPPLHTHTHRAQVGGDGGVALRRNVFLAVTLIRCCATTCTESGWAFITPVRHTSGGKVVGSPTRPFRRTAAVSGGGIRRASWLSLGREDLAGPGKPPGPGLENPALALRRAAE